MSGEDTCFSFKHQFTCFSCNEHLGQSHHQFHIHFALLEWARRPFNNSFCTEGALSLKGLSIYYVIHDEEGGGLPDLLQYYIGGGLPNLLQLGQSRPTAGKA